MTGWVWKTPSVDAARAAAEKLLPTLVAPANERGELGGDGARSDPFEDLEPLAPELLRRASLVAAQKFGALWAADERECAALAKATLGVLRHEFPELESELADPWNKLALVAGTYALPRVLALLLKATPPTSSPASTTNTDAKEEPRHVEHEPVS